MRRFRAGVRTPRPSGCGRAKMGRNQLNGSGVRSRTVAATARNAPAAARAQVAFWYAGAQAIMRPTMETRRVPGERG